MSKWLELLNRLLALGPKLPQIMASIDIIVSEIQAIIEIVSGGMMKESAPLALEEIKIDGKKSTAEVREAEEKVMAMCAQEGIAASDRFGGVFSNLLAFIKAHPELISLLLTFLK